MSAPWCRACGYAVREDGPAPHSEQWYREHKAAHLAAVPVDAVTLRNLDDEIADATAAGAA